MNIYGQDVDSTFNSDVRIEGDLTVIGTINGDSSGTLTVEDLLVTDTTQSTSTSTGAIICQGGVGIAKNLWVGGDMNVSGKITASDTYEVKDPLIHLGLSNPADVLDLGLVGEYTDGTVKYSGAYREAASKRFKFKDGITTNPTSGVITGGTESDLEFKDAYVDNINYNKNGAGNKFVLDGNTAGVMDISANTGFPTVNVGNSYTLGTQARLNIVGKGTVTTHNWGMSVDGGQCNSILGSSLGSFKWYDSALTALGTLDSNGLMTVNDVDCDTITFNGSTSGSVNLSATSTGDVQTYVLPSSYPSTGQVLACSDTGTMSWTDNTLQSAYTASAANPEILTNPTNGSINIRQGSGTNTDNVLTIQNGAGADTFTVDGNGEVDCMSINSTKSVGGDTSYVNTINNSYNFDGTKNCLLLNSTAISSYGENYLLTLQNEYNPTSFDNLSIRWRQNSVSALSTSILGVSSAATALGTYPSASMFLKNGGGFLYLDDTELRFHNTADKTLYVGLKQPASLAVSQTYTLPLLDGSSGQVLSTNGSGVMTWITDDAGAGTLQGLTDVSIANVSGNLLKIDGTTSILQLGSNLQELGSLPLQLGITTFTAAGSKGTRNTIIGHAAGFNLDFQSVTTPSNYNTMLGYSAGASVSTAGVRNTFLGYNSDTVKTNAVNLTCVGSNASFNEDNSVALGDSSVIQWVPVSHGACALGKSTNGFADLYFGGSTSGYCNITVPPVVISYPIILPSANGTSGQTLKLNASLELEWKDDTNVGALGDLSNCSTTGTTGNVIVVDSTDGNLLIGNSAGANITTATSSVCIGDNSGASITTTLQCVAVGKNANCALANSTSLGYNSSCTGANCTAVGYSTAASGISSVCLGTGSISAFDNATAVGATCSTVVTNSVALGNNAVTVVQPTSDNLCNLGAAAYRWKEIFCGNAVINTSDLRHKEEIIETDLGLQFINTIQPMKYCYKGDKQPHYGFVAQDVEKIIKKTLKTKNRKKYKNKGIVHYDEESDLYGIRYTELIAPLCKAVQELTGQLQLEKEHNNKLEKRLQIIEKVLSSE